MSMARTRARLLAVVAAAVLATASLGIGAVVAQTERTIEPTGPENSTQTTIGEDLDVQGILEIVPPSDDARLRLTDPSGQIWEVQTDLDDFAVLDLSGGAFPFFIADGAPNNSLTVTDNGNVGVGVFNPADDVHVFDPEPRIRLDRTSPGTSGNQAWSIGVNPAGDFFLRNDSVVRLRIFTDGRIRYNSVASAPAGVNVRGDLYSDTSGALCWFDGSQWLKIIGPGSCT